jgi:hypothetical protein
MAVIAFERSSEAQGPMEEAVADLVLVVLIQSLLWRCLTHRQVATTILEAWPTFQVTRGSNRGVPAGPSRRWFQYEEDGRPPPLYPTSELEMRWAPSHNLAVDCCYIHWAWSNHALKAIFDVGLTCKAWYKILSRHLVHTPQRTERYWQQVFSSFRVVPNRLPMHWPLRMDVFDTPRVWSLSLLGIDAWAPVTTIGFWKQLLHDTVRKPSCRDPFVNFPLRILIRVFMGHNWEDGLRIATYEWTVEVVVTRAQNLTMYRLWWEYSQPVPKFLRHQHMPEGQ